MWWRIFLVLVFSLNFPCLVLLCLLLLLHDEGEGLDLGDGEVECPDGGVGRVVSVSFVPWVCGGRYWPILCYVSSPDYLSLLTSSHPWEDRDKVQGCHLNINNYFQDWSYLAAVVAVLLVSQLRSTFPPLANTALCPHCRTGELATPWRAGCSVVEETMTPLHLASLGLMPAGRPQLHC